MTNIKELVNYTLMVTNEESEVKELIGFYIR